MKYALRASDPDAARELARAIGVSSAIGQILLQRGVSTPDAAAEFTAPRLATLTPPDGMIDRDLAADRLASAVRRGERIAVFGDYDVDGTTSAAILSGALQDMGGTVAAFVATRSDGYGFSDPALRRVMAWHPSVIVTCDCGSSDHERVATAMTAGIDVIVVDHHLVPAEALPALAFLNPHRPDCGFPYKGLASAGLVFLLAAAVRASLGTKIDLRPWLDLVALGTIADVAPLSGDNRTLVRAGLTRLSNGQARTGVRALCAVAEQRGARWGAIDVAFRLAPRLNAAGRIADPTLTLQLLQARDDEEAGRLATQINAINDQRRSIEREVTAAAVTQVRAVYGDALPSVIVVAGDGWHRGVVGITAARVAETFGVPAVVIAMDGDEGHGSGRAFGGASVYAALTVCNSMLRTFGGHHAAVGLSVERGRIDELRATLAHARVTEEGEGAPAYEATSVVDVVLDGVQMHAPTATDLWALEPVGESNPEPSFLLRDAVVDRARVVGDGHLKLNLRVGRQRLSAFGIGLGERMPAPGARLDALGNLRADHWAGDDQVELRLLDFETAQ